MQENTSTMQENASIKEYARKYKYAIICKKMQVSKNMQENTSMQEYARKCKKMQVCKNMQ